MTGSSGIQRFTYFLLAIILFFYAVIVAKDFLFPVTLGMLISYLLYPAANFLEKKGVHRILTIIISLLFVFTILFVSGFFIFRQIESLVAEFPTLRGQALKNIDTLVHSMESTFSVSSGTFEKFLKYQTIQFFETGSLQFNRIFSATTGTLFKLFILPVYVFLFLFYRTKFAYFILMLAGNENRRMTIKILRGVSQIASKYLTGLIIVVLILCVVNSAALSIIGIKYAIIIGVLSAVCTFIPYFGTIIGGALALVLTVLTSDNPSNIMMVGLYYILINTIENNILTPNIVGNNVRINPFVIIVSLIIAATVWGVSGMLVIIPFMSFLKVITFHHPKLQPYAFLLGMKGAKKHAIGAHSIKRAFKKSK